MNSTEVSINDFEIGDKIGRGRFGHVFKVERKSDKNTFAVKVLFKQELLQNSILSQLYKEVEIQRKMKHQYILRLLFVSQDSKRVYLFTEFAQYGNLYSYLQRLGRLPEHVAGKYIRQLLNALTYLHSNNVIHRDIKPENLLLSSSDDLLLADFGWCTSCEDEGRFTVCGTPDYLPPEMVTLQRYSEAVDSWTVGVLAFEFLTGHPPFGGISQAEKYNNIRTGQYKCPSYLSPDAAHFLSVALRVDPDRRYSAGELFLHRWTQSMNEQGTGVVEWEKEREMEREKGKGRRSMAEVSIGKSQSCEKIPASLSSALTPPLCSSTSDPIPSPSSPVPSRANNHNDKDDDDDNLSLPSSLLSLNLFQPSTDTSNTTPSPSTIPVPTPSAVLRSQSVSEMDDPELRALLDTKGRERKGGKEEWVEDWRDEHDEGEGEGEGGLDERMRISQHKPFSQSSSSSPSLSSDTENTNPQILPSPLLLLPPSSTRNSSKGSQFVKQPPNLHSSFPQPALPTPQTEKIIRGGKRAPNQSPSQTQTLRPFSQPSPPLPPPSIRTRPPPSHPQRRGLAEKNTSDHPDRPAPLIRKRPPPLTSTSTQSTRNKLERNHS